MPKIFISYRRADSRKDAGRIYDRMVDAFGKENIFKDVDNIPFGRDFRGVLSEAVNACDVLLAVIGTHWLEIADEQGNRRLDNPADFVRIEIQSALYRGDSRCLVIPVLIDHAVMPSPDNLPLDLRELAFKNAITVRDDPDFHRDMERLVNSLLLLDEKPKLSVLNESPQMHTELEPSLKREYKQKTESNNQSDKNNYLPYKDINANQQDAPEKDNQTKQNSLIRQIRRSNSESQHVKSVLNSFHFPTKALIVMVILLIPLILVLVTSVLPKQFESNLSLPTQIVKVTSIPTVKPSATADIEMIVARAGVKHNADWVSVQRSFDSVKMVLVPTGCFDMGNENGSDNQKPVNRQCFDKPFWIDKYEVPVFVYSRSIGKPYSFAAAGLPRQDISWLEANNFCAQRGAKLPSEREWEYAVRGPDNLIYTWGNAFVRNNVVYGKNSENKAQFYENEEEGASWVGALNLIGNAAEWTSSVYQIYPYRKDDGREDPNSNSESYRVVRGGSWKQINENALTTTFRVSQLSGDPVEDIGFRCIVSIS